MTVQSLASNLMYSNTKMRNEGDEEVLRAISQVGYALILVIALVESAVALPFTLLSLITLPFTRAIFYESVSWLKSSSFTILWSVVDLVLNPFMDRLVADERSARIIYFSGNLFVVPQGAVF